MSVATGKAIGASFQKLLRKKTFRHIPHGLLKQYPEYVVEALPDTFVEQLPAVPAGLVKITLHKSPVNGNPAVRGTLAALGLDKRYKSIVQKNNPQIRGMIHRVRTHVSVEEVPLQ
ncbi:hypothetical protein PPL_08144 [Heterostelium album PN500]|uniref:Large ribosomal subunit protein uL30m n=1 Tax=Heterostelium pallidum (strain ATCC 26659 / Pp 5 / PN500) TaxID=670386 RepID=D3BIQ9_HETP5|nr:hypothetical protein PPL_08144 [Heterostelium album PN500]EFA78683.1 hypothetical protein PPL_08144 [Heterostelium album PN500]|eukprot:XP_020430807.1 hypothetical protein PPL_08144 [Heterostelium album PN500]